MGTTDVSYLPTNTNDSKAAWFTECIAWCNTLEMCVFKDVNPFNREFD